MGQDTLLPFHCRISWLRVATSHFHPARQPIDDVGVLQTRLRILVQPVECDRSCQRGEEERVCGGRDLMLLDFSPMCARVW
jgi:hypothetical protein